MLDVSAVLECAMEPAFAHPLWISSGVLLMLVGFLLFRWARRSDPSAAITAATREATARKIFGGGRKTARAPQNLAPHRFRRAMSQLFGIIGFLLVIAGLMAAFLGIFYVGA
jgi:hypothetical protein